MTEREPGFYWVKFADEWIVSDFCGNDWWVCGYTGAINPEAIGPRIEKPEELK